MKIEMTEKRTIILAARDAARRDVESSSYRHHPVTTVNPYPADTEQHTVWQQFYEMTKADIAVQALMVHEYEASAY